MSCLAPTSKQTAEKWRGFGCVKPDAHKAGRTKILALFCWIVFVPEDELAKQPDIVIKDPTD